MCFFIAGVDPDFSRGRSWLLVGFTESIKHAPEMLQFENGEK